MNLQEKMTGIFDTHDLLRLGTLDREGFVDVRSVDFAYDPDQPKHVYFTTFKETKKVEELANDSRVYLVVDKGAANIQELASIKYVRGKGNAYPVEEQEESMKAMGLLMARYPFLSELPGDPSMMAVYRIELDEVAITDNSLGFGHVDTLML